MRSDELESCLRLIDEHEQKYRNYMNECSIEDSRTFYSNQTAVIALEDLKILFNEKFREKNKTL